jgi:hypothetical protein
MRGYDVDLATKTKTVRGNSSATGRLTSLAATLIVAASLLTALPAGAATGVETAKLTADTVSDLQALAVPIRNCTTNTTTYYSSVDAASPIFHFCYDWHSGVHAVWALHVIGRMTADPATLGYAASLVPASEVAAEKTYEQANIVDTTGNDPYGFAWMLRLVTERMRSTGDNSLLPLGQYAAAEIQHTVNAMSDADVKTGILAQNHLNLSWAMTQLYEWATYRNNTTMQAWAQGKVTKYWKLASLDSCTASQDASTTAGVFIPACLMRLVAVGVVLGSSASSWISSRIPSGFSVPPYPNVPADHTNALNFSRAYALFYLADLLRQGNAATSASLDDNGAALVNWQIARPAAWTVDYANTHWIAQFGVLAIERFTL